MLGFLSNRRLAEIAAGALAVRPPGPVAVIGPPALARALARAGVDAVAHDAQPPDGDARFAGLVLSALPPLASWLPRLADGARVVLAVRSAPEEASAALIGLRVIDLASASARPLVLTGRIDARLTSV